jgi:hypothetical protein
MRILLIDVDSTIPNIALMKLSTFHKLKGDTVKLIQYNIPYYPNRKKTKCIVPDGYDIIYCSVIFEGNSEYIIGNNIIFGGTGYDFTVKLSDNIEALECDYSIYPNNDTSYGFISRGCIRKCYFCKVHKKEGMIKQVNTPKEIIRHSKVKFLDNNFLALSNSNDILRELISLKVKCQFNQGLDIRLINLENSSLLKNLNYLHDYIFAFDDIKFSDMIRDKLNLLSWRKPFQLKFFVYVHPNMPLSDTVYRIEFLKKYQCLPYIMRDISCWKSEYCEFYIDLAAYCNQVNIFKKMTFMEFLNKRHTNSSRILSSKNLYISNMHIQG